MEQKPGNIFYLGLYSVDAIKTTAGDATTSWKWKIPSNFPVRKAPVFYLSVVSVFCNDTDGENKDEPHFLRLLTNTENYFPSSGYPVVAQLDFTSLPSPATNHYWTLTNGVCADVVLSSNTQYLTFDVVNENMAQIPVQATTGESLNIVVKLIFPEHNEIRDNTLMSYAQSQVGNPPFNRL